MTENQITELEFWAEGYSQNCIRSGQIGRQYEKRDIEDPGEYRPVKIKLHEVRRHIIENWPLNILHIS